MANHDIPPNPPLVPDENKVETPQMEAGSVDKNVEKRDWEDVVYDAFSEKELQNRWLNKLRPLVLAGTISNAEACRMIDEAMAGRASAVGSYVPRAEQGSDRQRESSGIFDRLMETQTSENEIGRGNVAKVYEVAGARDFCLKVVWNQEAYKEENTVSQESSFLEDLSDFTVDGVRTPKYIDFFSGLQMNAILMERIDGAGLDKIMAGEEDFPDDFSLDDFFGKLKKYLEALHEKKIFHMDIAPRNIMIERKTGLPVVIDFGKSRHYYLSEEVKENDARTDFESLRKTKKEVKDFIRTGLRPQLLALDKYKKL